MSQERIPALSPRESAIIAVAQQRGLTYFRELEPREALDAAILFLRLDRAETLFDDAGLAAEVERVERQIQQEAREG